MQHKKTTHKINLKTFKQLTQIIMSLKQQNILAKLLGLASQSPQGTRVAAAICSGSKILAMEHNTHRSKYGSHIRCSGHAEIAAIHKFFPYAFRGKGKWSRVL